MRTGDLAKADECFREAVSINQAHGPSMLLAAIIAWINEQFDVASSLFQAATHFQPSARNWAIRGLYHALREDDISRDMCMTESKQLQNERKTWMEASEFLLDMKVQEFCEPALKELRLEYPDSQTPEVAATFARHHLQQKQYTEALALLEKSIAADVKNPCTVAVKGHVLYRNKDIAAARDTYQRALDLPGHLADLELIRLRLACLYLDNAEYTKGKELFMQATATQPSALSWEGVGICCFRLGNIEEAERALAESNMYDNANPQVWGYLSLLCLTAGRRVEAEQTFKYALRHGLVDEDLLKELKTNQESLGYGQPFVDAL